MDVSLTAAAFIGGYFLGSIPFGLVLAMLAGHGDIRKIGSGNIGATNVLRTGNKPLAAAVLILDAGKGAIAVQLARMMSPDLALAAAFGAVLGHLFPVWLGFKGGKGVATALGTLIALSWPVGIAACGVWLLAASIFRFSSLAALLAMLSAPILSLVWIDTTTAIVVAVIAGMVWWRHAANIKRLLAGTEPRIGKRPA